MDDIIEDDEEAEDSTYFHLKQARHCSLFESIDENGMFINEIVWGPASIANSDIEFFRYRTQFVNLGEDGLDLRWRCQYNVGFEHFREEDMVVSTSFHLYDCEAFDVDDDDYPDYNDHLEHYNTELDTGMFHHHWFFSPRVLMQTCNREHEHFNRFVAQQEVFISYVWRF